MYPYAVQTYKFDRMPPPTPCLAYTCSAQIINSALMVGWLYDGEMFTSSCSVPKCGPIRCGRPRSTMLLSGPRMKEKLWSVQATDVVNPTDENNQSVSMESP